MAYLLLVLLTNCRSGSGRNCDRESEMAMLGHGVMLVEGLPIRSRHVADHVVDSNFKDAVPFGSILFVVG